MNHSELLRCIDAAEVVSFDVFDTLFVRPLSDPEDAFDMLGERFGIAGFRRIRCDAQIEAFRQMHIAGQGEVTLDGIYACMTGLPAGVSAASLRQAEYELELALTVPNADLIGIFKNVVGRKHVIVVSDMYMPQAFFEELFDKYALPRVPMYISADRGATKRDYGELFVRVVAELGVSPDKVVHIGDNPHGDVLRAREHGLQAFHYVNAVAATYPVSLSLGASIAAAMTKLHDRRDAVNTFYGLGYRFGGPAALGLLEWVRDQAVIDAVDVVLFVARDGYVLDQLVQRGHAPGMPSHAYFRGSRVSFALSTINEGNFDQWMDFLVSGCHGLSPDEVLERIGVTAPARSVMEDMGLGDGVIIDGENLGRVRDFLSAYRAEIIRTAARNRRGLFNSLHSLGIRAGMRVAMVDVGWSGTTQETLRNALAELFDVELVGYYLGLADTVECHRRRGEMPMKALLDSSSVGVERMAKLYERRVGIEMMFSAPHESTIGYELMSDGTVRAVEDAGRGADHLALREAVRELMHGMLDFADSYKAVSDRLQYRARASELAHAALDFAHMPVAYCEVLYALKNSDAWGSSRNLSMTVGDYSQG